MGHGEERLPSETTLTAGSCCQHANATLLTHTIDANDDANNNDFCLPTNFTA